MPPRVLTLLKIIGRTTLLAGLLLTSCSPDLSRARADRLLRDHLSQVLPHLTITPSVSTVLVASETEREVRARLLTIFTDSMGVERSDSSQVESFVFQRSDEGWTLVRYGPATVSTMAFFWAVGWRHEYIELLVNLGRLSPVLRDWARATSERAYELMDEARGPDARVRFLRARAVADSADIGPSPERFRLMVDSANLVFSEGITWGYVQGLGDVFSALFWVKREGPDPLECAEVPYYKDLSPPVNFSWVSREYRETCRGGKWVYNGPLGSLEDAEQAILRNGGIIPF